MVAPVQNNQCVPHPAATGIGMAGPSGTQDAQQFAQGFTDPASALRFTTTPADAPVAQRTQHVLSNLAANSPTYSQALQTATDGGRHPIIVAFSMDKTLRFGADWSPTKRTVTVEPLHPNVDPRQGGAGTASITAFEVANASNRDKFSNVHAHAIAGHYEMLAEKVSQNSGRPAAAGTLFARDMEYAEYNSIRSHHKMMTEAQEAGIQLPPGADMYKHDFSHKSPVHNWHSFNGYYSSQLQNGHTQNYVNRYDAQILPYLQRQGLA